ncbi:hypothetical protein OJ996_11255 [Luteolibacter sp. GHJ8]|uniref:Uncharacterized protein n=1 Tax=Luteolibacter rhizosphaerae TaxID=2989719 RepID=A0ABT3G2T6_9BACT|nr:hypothetical protein [Luteolibacter rhizosphaerae]MCW1914157.1 hypothetical protein [Luteolibacter rhizosphaerae]
MSRRSDREIAARVLLLAAFVCLIGFHVLPIDEVRSDGSVERGWIIWQALWVYRRDLDALFHAAAQEPLVGMGLVAAVSWLLLALVSPFIVPLLLRSRPLWGICTMIAGLSLVAWLIIIGSAGAPSNFSGIPPAMLSMLASVLLNFLGLAVLARIKPLDPVLPESPDNPLAP